ncbi:cysteine desulfurase [Mergibacter septicus]|uniref:aminotransferase class V-fold PLP-dependent enzyme n=1 Tax=Mergibacter septicus TaxID=221402 RepID=UPI001C783669|nr:cysteine desulfurase [Mergibacter septicus]QDJ12515.1 cysteine desulfurase [Mergibacter septicus]
MDKIQSQPFDFSNFRQQFPFFKESQIVYLDSTATTLKPQVLLDSTLSFYRSAGSVHRSQYDYQQTQQYEQARQNVASWLNAESKECIIWTSGTTASINLVGYGLLPNLTADDHIIITQAEHHANYVSWVEFAKKNHSKLHIVELDQKHKISTPHLIQSLSSNTKLVALNLISNVTGIRQPIEQLIPLIRQAAPQALILLDVAQAILHHPIDLQQLDIDFCTFSCHKIYGPTGLGILAGKRAALEQLSPMFFGGKMVERIENQHVTFTQLPYRLEAGTPNIAAVIGFGAVLDWLQQFDVKQMAYHSLALAQQCRQRLSTYPTCRIFSEPTSTIISFIFIGIENSDLATLLSEQNIALRSGEHCAKPYLHHLALTGTLRVSFSAYNNQNDLDRFFTALDAALSLLTD